MSDASKPSRITTAETHKKTTGTPKNAPKSQTASTGKLRPDDAQTAKKPSGSRKPAAAGSSSRVSKRIGNATPTVNTPASQDTPLPGGIVGEPFPAAIPTETVPLPEVSAAQTQGADSASVNDIFATPQRSDSPVSSAPAVPVSTEAEKPTHELTSSISTDPADVADPEGVMDVDSHPDITDESDEIPAEDNIDLDEVRIQLTALQQQIRAAKVPVVIVVEGWGASGKGTMVSKLMEGLDPRGYQVYPIRKATPEENAYPRMRRYWVDMPSQGNISIFCASWYREVTHACFENKSVRKRLNQRYQEIIDMESQLVCDGTLLIKLFLHIPRKEQKARLKALESKKSTRWHVDKDDWYQNEHYEDYLRLYDAMIARTHFDGAQWHIIRSDSKRSCIKQIYDVVIESFLGALRDREIGRREWDVPYLPHLEGMTVLPFPALETFDPEQALTAPYKPAIDKAQKQLRKLQSELYQRGIPMAVCFEGWDAAGKGGAIRRLMSALDPRASDVVPIASPTPLELSHHYLWRFWNTLPRDGEIVLFDRTWYGRVMVERVEGFCTESQWRRAYEEINRFEAELAEHGTILCKFWLHIDPETQLTRFQDRQNSQDKQWKITPDDWRNREKWPQYEMAVNDMLQKTNTVSAPWTVVEANNKQYARLKVLHTVIKAIEQRLEAERV